MLELARPGAPMLIDNIGRLLTNEPSLGEGRIGLLRDAAVLIDGDRVVWVGDRRQVPEAAPGERVDAGGRCVLPGFVDSHTHLVFAGDRAEEFAARMDGRPYGAGGIRTTVMATRAAGDEELLSNAQRLANEALAGGTTTLEVKSGYGLNIEDERRSLEVAARVGGEPTFLGAHVVAPEFESRPDAYVDLVCGPMLDACAGLARWCDVFCDRGAFDADQSRAVLEAARRHGLGLRVHANQLGHGPGAQLAAGMAAASADHLTHLTDSDIEALAGTGVVATLLPAAEFSTRSPYPDARRLVEAGATIALATDCNPGTSYTTSMAFVIALAVRELGLSPDEAVLAATLGGARALRRNDIGVISPGARADLVILEAPSHVHLAYRPGVALIAAVIRGGAVVEGR